MKNTYYLYNEQILCRMCIKRYYGSLKIISFFVKCYTQHHHYIAHNTMCLMHYYCMHRGLKKPCHLFNVLGYYIINYVFKHITGETIINTERDCQAWFRKYFILDSILFIFNNLFNQAI